MPPAPETTLDGFTLEQEPVYYIFHFSNPDKGVSVSMDLDGNISVTGNDITEATKQFWHSLEHIAKQSIKSWKHE